ncbi:unnamed protein product [Cochlearia groenlandica]
MNLLRIDTEDTFSSLLELAANNDVENVRLSIERDPSCLYEAGLWYGRSSKGTKSTTMVNDLRTPLMVASTYGSLDVIKLILSLTDDDANVNRICGNDKTTALHCAASGGALNAVQVVKLLLAAGADPRIVDRDGQRAFDVIVVLPNLEGVKLMLQELLCVEDSSLKTTNLRVVTDVTTNSVCSPSHSPSCGENGEEGSPFKRRGYPVDPSLPDIKNSVYATDEFRMYSFKVRPCSRAYSHDWTECPFVHPGENARRRDPRKFHYSCVPCPDFKKGACRRGDMCEYAHGVFECWLHPAQYRTRLCKDGTGCGRRVCFFAHRPEELRPLYASTGSAVPPQARSNTDFVAALGLLPGSPSPVSGVMSPLSPSATAAANMAWPQPNVPALHLPGSNIQSSRLRSSFNARDIPQDEFNMLADYELQLNGYSPLSRSGRMKSMPHPSNLEDLFSSSEAGGSSLSPRFTDSPAAVYSPTHKSTVFNHQSMLSPINTSFSSPKSVDHSLFSGRMSPRNVVDPISPMSSRVSMLAQCVQQQQQQQHQFRSLSSRELRTSSSPIVGSPVHNNSTWSTSQWGSSNGKPDWGMNSDPLGDNEPDVSWVQSLVKEQPNKAAAAASLAVEAVKDHEDLEAWIEEMKLDQLVAHPN